MLQTVIKFLTSLQFYELIPNFRGSTKVHLVTKKKTGPGRPAKARK